MSIIIDGKQIAKEIREKLKNELLENRNGFCRM